MKNTRTRTSMAAADGFFKVNVSLASVLVITSIGYQLQEVSVGKQKQSAYFLKTRRSVFKRNCDNGIGIRREKKALGYAASTVNKKDLNNGLKEI